MGELLLIGFGYLLGALTFNQKFRNWVFTKIGLKKDGNKN